MRRGPNPVLIGRGCCPGTFTIRAHHAPPTVGNVLAQIGAGRHVLLERPQFGNVVASTSSNCSACSSVMPEPAARPAADEL